MAKPEQPFYVGHPPKFESVISRREFLKMGAACVYLGYAMIAGAAVNFVSTFPTMAEIHRGVDEKFANNNVHSQAQNEDIDHLREEAGLNQQVEYSKYLLSAGIVIFIFGRFIQKKLENPPPSDYNPAK